MVVVGLQILSLVWACWWAGPRSWSFLGLELVCCWVEPGPRVSGYRALGFPRVGVRPPVGRAGSRTAGFGVQGVLEAGISLLVGGQDPLMAPKVS